MKLKKKKLSVANEPIKERDIAMTRTNAELDRALKKPKVIPRAAADRETEAMAQAIESKLREAPVPQFNRDRAALDAASAVQAAAAVGDPIATKLLSATEPASSDDAESAIAIGESLRITKDALNWVVESRTVVGEKKTGKGRAPSAENIGKVRWIVEGYYSNCEQALRACLDSRLKEKLDELGKVDVRAFLDALNEVKMEIRAALSQATVLAAKIVQTQESV